LVNFVRYYYRQLPGDNSRFEKEGPGPDRVSPPENRERELLSKESLHAGWRLACCTRVFGPIAIEISDGSLLVPEVVQKGSSTVVVGFSLHLCKV
jgi:hypothetical protein